MEKEEGRKIISEMGTWDAKILRFLSIEYDCTLHSAQLYIIICCIWLDFELRVHCL